VPPKRYTFVIADRETGVVRRFTVRLRTGLVATAAVFSIPVLMGLGARWSAVSEIDFLRQSIASLEQENSSYRAATEALTGQIASLQSAVTELGVKASIDPATARAIDKLPGVLRNRAIGGTSSATAPLPLFPTGVNSLEDSFGIMRDLLQGMETRLNVVRKSVERRQALANATPSLWPVFGWLSGSYGQRTDPFTGDSGFHRGLDISADRGQPVFATASGKVVIASYAGDYGNLVVIDHGFGLTTRYGHLSTFKVRSGARVNRGDVIGLVGATGRATGPHLHYEVLANGQLLNPLRLLTSRPRR
jgi:murein DD-endopeptidase MepM/ murein hydrolase activator NlpD